MKIVSAGIHGLTKEQKNRLQKLGVFVCYEDIPVSKEEKLSNLKNADVVLGETDFVMDVIYDLKNKLISFPFVGVGFLDLDRLAKNNVKIANAPGCNKDAVSEWIVAMLLLLSRKLLKYSNTSEIKKSDFMENISGLSGKNLTILGKGNVGSRVGAICNELNMKVEYFDKGDDLTEKIKDADFVVNALAYNKETEKLLDKEFFKSLKEGAYFVSITDTEIFDEKAFLDAIKSGIIAGAAIDPAGASIFDTSSKLYKGLLSNEKVIVTPHIAFHSDMTLKMANQIMIDNCEAWIKKAPQNLVN
ncbi:hypothetical protein A2V71_00595 [Candidatus Berkelbacteria bacterium RBG_13_40_8]|uniref:D-isomer specific 2-hydroxyacid dehydrogenase NAD-binding domain-containing protein n=1 Tax=Candidatus Berkelbacteria bacterium RBG_13_40_8 TaxID=1797467 RepID=A0A1F5DQH4_9BACT|nr:MAG: hypothetical protein A2V71_00595 [Candidatus Berkelbacteria bacterium RBG_13_40_8]